MVDNKRDTFCQFCGSNQNVSFQTDPVGELDTSVEYNFWDDRTHEQEPCPVLICDKCYISRSEFL